MFTRSIKSCGFLKINYSNHCPFIPVIQTLSVYFHFPIHVHSHNTQSENTQVSAKRNRSLHNGPWVVVVAEAEIDILYVRIRWILNLFWLKLLHRGYFLLQYSIFKDTHKGRSMRRRLILTTENVQVISTGRSYFYGYNTKKHTMCRAVHEPWRNQ